MANNVFANGREISCKKADGKTICAFPDVCMTPPVTGVTPNGVPIPYPNTGMAKDTANGSRTVKISGNEIIKKNVSYYKTSYGDEAGCATPAKKGIITGTIQGKVYFTSWSMDVKVEGENAVRHLDTTTHNHGSNPNHVIPWTYLDRIEMAKGLKSCSKELAEVDKHCPKDKTKKVRCPDHRGIYTGPSTKMVDRSQTGMENYAVKIRKGRSNVTKCHRALRCMLVPYEKSGKRLCCPPQTPEHLVPKSCLKGVSGYISNDAPCMCAIGGKSDCTHGLIGAERSDILNKKGIKYRDNCEFVDLLNAGSEAANRVNPQCSKKCTRAQLKRGAHKNIALNEPVKNEQENVNKDNSGLSARLKKATKG